MLLWGSLLHGIEFFKYLLYPFIMYRSHVLRGREKDGLMVILSWFVDNLTMLIKGDETVLN